MRLVIDNEQNLDENNIYLKETGGGGTPAIGGTITIDSLSSMDIGYSKVSFNLGSGISYPLTPYNGFTVLRIDGVDYLFENLASGIVNASAFITELINNIPTLFTTNNYELVSDGDNLIVKSSVLDFSFNGEVVELFIRTTTTPNHSIEFGMSADGTGETLDLSFTLNSVACSVTSYPISDGSTTDLLGDSIADAINSALSIGGLNSNFEAVETAPGVIQIRYKTSSILIKDFSLVSFSLSCSNPSVIILDYEEYTSSKLKNGTLEGGNGINTEIELNIGSILLIGDNNDFSSSTTKEQFATILANVLNTLPAFEAHDEGNGVTVVGSTLLFKTTVGFSGYNDIVPTLNVIAGIGSITTSASSPLTGGVDDANSITPTLQPIAKSRKGFFAGDEAHIKGFCGFIMLGEVPESLLTQVDFFGLDANKVVIDTENGIGFTHRIKTMADGTHYFAHALRLIDNQVSDDPQHHLWLKIGRVGSFLTIDLCSLNNTTPKTTIDGWKYSVSDELVVVGDELPYVENEYLRFIYPYSNATIAQFLTLSNLNTVTKVKNIFPSAVLTDLNDLLDNKTFTLPHIAGNVGANTVLSVVRADGK